MEPSGVYMLVLDTLHRASNQDVGVLKPAAKQLSEWETEPGFYSILLSIFSNHSIDTNVRWLASVTFKNAVDRYWRKKVPHAIADEEKRKLRAGLLSPSVLNEPVNQIASQLAVLVSKIARFDCPTEWPELVPSLLNSMKTTGSLEQHRALLIFHHVVKAMATKRLLHDKRVFQELTATVYSYVLGIWDDFTQTFLRQIQESATTETITASLEKAVYSLKILKKLTLHGFKKPHESPDAMAFLSSVFDRAKTSLECRKLLKGRGVYLLELCEKFIINLTNVALGTLESFPMSYVSLLAPSLEFSAYYCFTEQGMHLAFERFTVQCLNLLKAILLCKEYKVKGMHQSVDPETASACDIKLRILTDDTVCHMCRTLVTHFFLLTSDDLALWDADGENFATDLVCEAWKCNLRPCVESFFMALFHEYRTLIISEVLTLLKMIRQEPINSQDLSAILRKDAIYNAVGQIATDLFDEINFDEWFTTQLIEELKVKDNNYRIIRRRTASLIGIWSRVKVSQELKPMLYQSLLELMSESEDVAVRLAACDALNMILDDFNFSPEQFAPFVQPVFSLLLNLLKEAEECDTKMHVLTILTAVVESNEGAVRSHTSELLSYLPLLWDSAADHNMLRCAIVSNLVHLVKALGYWITPEMQALVLGVLEEATNPKKEAYVYLLEDGMELWQAVLEVTPLPIACFDQLLQLSSNLPQVIEDTSEYLRLAIYIARAYILLAPVDFLKGAGAEFMTKLGDMISDMQVEGVIAVYKLAEVCVKVEMPEPNEMLGFQLIWPMYRKILLWPECEQHNPSLLTLRFSLVSRLLLRSQPLFFEAVKEACADWKSDPNELLAKILDELNGQLSLVVRPDRRKLIGLGLGTLLTGQIPCVLERFGVIMVNITEILNDVMKEGEVMGEFVDGLLLNDNNPPSPCDSWNSLEPNLSWESPHQVRLRQHSSSDVMYNVDLKAFITNQLLQLQSQVGEKVFKEMMMEKVQWEILKELSCYIPLLK